MVLRLLVLAKLCVSGVTCTFRLFSVQLLAWSQHPPRAQMLARWPPQPCSGLPPVPGWEPPQLARRHGKSDFDGHKGLPVGGGS